MEILLLHPGGMGDIILALPAIDLLKQRFPAAGITLACNLDHAIPLIGAAVEKGLSLSRLPLHRIYTGEALPQQDLSFWGSFDLIISWTGAGNPGFERNFEKIHPRVLVRSWRPALDESRHVSRIFADSLSPEIDIGLPISPSLLKLGSEWREKGEQWFAEKGLTGESVVALHPGAGAEWKRWPVENYVALAQRLIEKKGRTILVSEGPAEQGLAQAIVRAIPSERVLVDSAASLGLTAGLLQKCELFIGNDSGIAHLAAALQIPTTVIFGPTNPCHWAPLGEHVRILSDSNGCAACSRGAIIHSGFENIALDDALEALR